MKYTSSATQEIAAHLAAGHRRLDACALAGIDEATFYRWMRKASFASAVNLAELKAKDAAIVMVREAGHKDWRAAAWWLERRHPDEYVARQKVEHGGRLTLAQLFASAPEQNRTEDLVSE